MTPVEWTIWVGAALVLLLFSSALVGCEFALVKLRYGVPGAEEMNRLRGHKWIWRMIEGSDHTARVLRFCKTGCTIFFGIWMLGFFKGVQQAWTPTLEPSILLLGLAALAVALVFHYIVVELLPRGLALRNPVQILHLSYPLLLTCEGIAWPFMALLRLLKGKLFRWLRLNLEEDLNPLDVEVQIRALGENTAVLSKVVRSIINRTLQMRDLIAADILLPRNQVIIFDTADGIEANLEVARMHGHTRYPLCEGDLDHCIGIIHIKDLFRYRRDLVTIDLERMSRPIVRFKENEPLEKVFQRMLNYKMHMALVQDEFGGILGVLTLERILEVLVGEIQDEFDAEESMIVRLGAGRFRISGLAPVHDLEKELGITIENIEVATFGGLVTAEAGTIPDVGEKVFLDGMEVIVREVDDTRIISALVTVKEKIETEDN